MDQVELIATASFGLEAVVSRELQALGYENRTVEDGRVTFRAPLSAIAKCNLWLRSADRVLVKAGEFEAHDFGQLFDQTCELPWRDWLPVDAEFPVRGRSVRSQLSSVPDCQAIVKKAIVESLKKTYRKDWFPETGPLYPVEIAMLKDRATLTIDTTGPGLHKRGYRTLQGDAPLKETLAAALVQLSYWNPDRILIDPFCGTGTIPIEAALIGCNMAPGLNRTFSAETWPQFGEQDWQEARTEAHDVALGSIDAPMIGTDCDDRALSKARFHAKQAGVEQQIHFQKKELSEFTTSRHYGCIICNPPYGERIGEEVEAESLYREMRKKWCDLETWSIYVLTSYPEFERLFDRKAGRRRKIYNGRIACTYYQFPGPPPPRRRES